ncbi:MAG: YqgE/AlgH family protein [Nibricoccus sp.]
MRERRSTNPTALAGSLLLAHPSMRDPNFRRAVVLLSAHDEKGAMGVVLNRPLEKRLGQLNADFALSPLANVPLFQGGPVQTEQLLLCAWKFHADQNGFQLMFGIDPNKAIELHEEEGTHLRAFLGYAGWTGGQLENELKQNAWVVTPLVAELMEEQPNDALWRNILTELDSDWKLLVNEPDDPSLN